MAYSIIAQTNSTTTLADENGNVITVPSRSILDAGTTFTLVKINNNTATLEDSNGKVYRDIPCCIDLTQVTGFTVTKVNNNKATLEDGDGNVFAGVPCVVNLTGTGGGSAVIEELNVTPSTSAQTITASGGTDGYSPVNVSAVDASIDANITAGNIKNGVEILGVTGSVIELNGETKTVTPQVYGQTLYPTAPKNAITEITVNAVTSSIDANIQAGNIKDGVQILGVTGNYTGSTPTGTISITSNGTHDVSAYANASVNVPTTAPALYREFEITPLGLLQQNTTTTHIMNFAGIKNIDQHLFASMYYQNTAISGPIDMSDLVGSLYDYACFQMFANCPNITSANLSKLETITGSYACSNMFNHSGITSFDLSSLKTVDGSGACNNMFIGCSGLTNINLPSLNLINAGSACQQMFYLCTGITSIGLPFLTRVIQNGACSQICSGCTGLTNIDIPSLTAITGAVSAISAPFYYAFKDCSALTSLSFPSITPNSFGSRTHVFDNMCSGITGITIHFPSNVQTQVSALSGYSTTAPWGATSGTVLFDLPATYTLTGADTNTYTRNPKYDTATALAWKPGAYGDTDFTPYYTSGTSDPSVSDTIYSDSACTTPVTTISSIA